MGGWAMPHSRRGAPMGFVDMLIARWRALRRGDVVAIFLLAAFMGLLVIAAVVKHPGFTTTGNLGFGPDGNASTQAKANRSASRSQRPPRESAKSPLTAYGILYRLSCSGLLALASLNLA